MGLFKKKDQTDENSQVVDTSSPKKAAKQKNRKKAGMSQVLNESVPATVVEELKENKAFIHHSPDGDKYVGLLFHVADIGGLDKKSRKIEAKGSLIEAINSGNLKTVITPELMEAEQIVFIPDMTTLNSMLEYSLLDASPETGEPISYDLVYVNVDALGNKIDVTPVEPEMAMTFKEVCTFLVDDEGVVDSLFETEEEEEPEVDAFDETFGDNDSSEADASPVDDGIDDIDDIDDISDSSSVDDFDDDIDAFDDNIDDIDNIDNIDDVDAAVDSYDESGSGDYDYDSSVDPYGNDGYDDTQMNQEPEEQETEVPSEWMDTVVTRQFYSDDLGLEITTEPFDAQFLQGNGFVPFDENRPSGWLNDQLNEMARQANAEMDRMHTSNLFLMRERYFKLMSKHADRIQKDLDAQDERTQYGQIMKSLNDARDQEFENVSARATRKKEELEAAFKRKLQEVGQDAARAAQHQYRDRYGKQHEDELFHLEDTIKASVEDEYHDAVHEVNERRRMEASKLLDLGITEVLDEVSDLYMAALTEENIRYKELEEGMKAFVDDNRRNDISRTNTLAEELRQKQKADVVLAEQTEKIRNLQAGFDAERSSLQSEIETIRKDNTNRINEIKSHSDEVIARERERVADLQKQIEVLRDQNEKMYDKAKAECEHQITEKQDEILALHNRLGEAAVLQKRTSRIATYLVIAIAICAIGAGFILGTYIRVNDDVKAQQQSITQEYKQTQDSSDSHK